MPSLNIAEIESRELAPGYHGRVIHSDTMTFIYWEVEPGSPLPEHAHHHEQVAHILEGEFEITVDGVPSTYSSGDVVTIPANAVHSGRAHTRCRFLDVFHPVREDYR